MCVSSTPNRKNCIHDCSNLQSLQTNYNIIVYFIEIFLCTFPLSSQLFCAVKRKIMQEIKELHRDDNNGRIGLVKNAKHTLHIHIPIFAYESAYERMYASNLRKKKTFGNSIH